MVAAINRRMSGSIIKEIIAARITADATAIMVVVASDRDGSDLSMRFLTAKPKDSSLPLIELSDQFREPKSETEG